MRKCFIMRFPPTHTPPHAGQYVTKMMMPFLLDVPSRVQINGISEEGLQDILMFRSRLKEDTVGTEDQTALSH